MSTLVFIGLVTAIPASFAWIIRKDVGGDVNGYRSVGEYLAPMFTIIGFVILIVGLIADAVGD